MIPQTHLQHTNSPAASLQRQTDSFSSTGRQFQVYWALLLTTSVEIPQYLLCMNQMAGLCDLPSRSKTNTAVVIFNPELNFSDTATPSARWGYGSGLKMMGIIANIIPLIIHAPRMSKMTHNANMSHWSSDCFWFKNVTQTCLWKPDMSDLVSRHSKSRPSLLLSPFFPVVLSQAGMILSGPVENDVASAFIGKQNNVKARFPNSTSTWHQQSKIIATP